MVSHTRPTVRGSSCRSPLCARVWFCSSKAVSRMAPVTDAEEEGSLEGGAAGAFLLVRLGGGGPWSCRTLESRSSESSMSPGPAAGLQGWSRRFARGRAVFTSPFRRLWAERAAASACASVQGPVRSQPLALTGQNAEDQSRRSRLGRPARTCLLEKMVRKRIWQRPGAGRRARPAPPRAPLG